MLEEDREPVTADIAAARLSRRPGTIRSWGTRYNARTYGTFKGKTVYDWHDVKTIARQIKLGLPVPATPEDRDALRASIQRVAA